MFVATMAQSKTNGSHYALTAIGLGMLVLGIIVAVWNLLPGFAGFSHKDKPSVHGNSSSTSGGTFKSKTFSVSYVLVGAGIVLLLLSICLNIRDKQKQRRGEEEVTRSPHNAAAGSQMQEEDSQEEEESQSRYYVPSYEEVMSTNYSGVRELDQNPGMTTSLPSYESLTGLDEMTSTTAEASTETHPPDRQNSRLAKRLKPLKVRRIKSEKLHLKDFRINLPEGNLPPPTIEPLTPPPQYNEVQEKAAADTRQPN